MKAPSLHYTSIDVLMVSHSFWFSKKRIEDLENESKELDTDYAQSYQEQSKLNEENKYIKEVNRKLFLKVTEVEY
jgi:hypothetical protein